MKKIDLAMSLINANPGWLKCPVCGEPLAPRNGNTVACGKRHNFDLSAAGALNLLRGKAPEDYGTSMLESRRLVCKAGFFDSLMDAVASLLVANGSGSSVRLLDAGCGEGSQLMMVQERLAKQGVSVSVIGVDISKDAIRIAAREHSGALWLVADLARLPLMDRSAGAILNILSPINYAEFERVLAEDGVVIKTVPGNEYLMELRRLLYAGEGRERYSNEQVVSLFEQRFDVVAATQVSQAFPVSEELWPHIVAMTPLSWESAGQRREDALASPPDSVTLDFLVMAGRKKNEGGGAR